MGRWGAELEPEAESHLVAVANGDARNALNALEAAVLATAGTANGLFLTIGWALTAYVV